MKRLLFITCFLGTVLLAGVLYGSYSRLENADSFSLNKVYSTHYPQTVPTISLIPVTYCSM
jgi:hypothetical protein